MNKISWLDHIANLLVVILGISIAFYLEGYKDEKSNRRQQEKYLASLVEDLQTDLEALDTLKIANQFIRNSLVKLSDASIGIDFDSDSLLTYLFAPQYNPPFTPQLTTYESLKSSGKMDLIEDFDLRNEIVELYEQYYRGTRQYDVSIDQHLRDFYKPFYMRNVTFIDAYQVRQDFLQNSEFRNIIFSYRYLFFGKTSFYDVVRVKLEETLESLEAYQKAV